MSRAAQTREILPLNFVSPLFESLLRFSIAGLRPCRHTGRRFRPNEDEAIVSRSGYFPPALILRVNAKLRDSSYRSSPIPAILVPYIRTIRAMTEHDINRSFELAQAMVEEDANHGGK